MTRSVLLFLLPLGIVPAVAQAQTDVEAGKTVWESFENDCKFCHGFKGEGGFGSALAGHRLTPVQFLAAVREGRRVMPAFNAEKNMSDQQVAQVSAYLASLPKPTGPKPDWYTRIPPLATARQKLMINTGCGMCHGPTMANPRKTAGGEGADYEWFKKEVWEHTTAPRNLRARHLRMGNYSKEQLPEATLKELWQFFGVDEGLRVPIAARINRGVPGANGVTYTVTLQNTGTAGKGLRAEYLTVTLPLPVTGKVAQQTSTVVAAQTGPGFIGVHREPITNTEAAEWEIPKLGPGEKLTYTFTLSGNGAERGIPRGVVRWQKPLLATGGMDIDAVAPPPAEQ